MSANQPTTVARRARRWALLSSLTFAGSGCTPVPTTSPAEAVPECCKPAPDVASADPGVPESTGARVTIPDLTLLDQDGTEVRFASEVIRDRVVAINFIFTACKAACPSIGLNFARLQERMRDRLGKDCVLVTISVDPENDRPEVLKAWPARFNFEVGPGWYLLTGGKAHVDRLLKALNSYSPERQSHSQMIVLGDPIKGDWQHVPAMLDPAKLSELLDGYLDARSATPAGPGPAKANTDAARAYFTDAILVNQYDEEMRFYSDLLDGKVVVINPFFAECKDSCVKMSSTMKYLQDHLGDRVGKDVHLISLSVDPSKDSPDVLAKYAENFGARRGWYFLGGKPETVAGILGRLGMAVARREDHTTVMIVANVPTGLWKKARGLSPPDEILELVEGVLADPGEK
jgi:cytochrome oxidase Cu insertion factor (SCO1/SenC/PrrC family)